MQGETFVPPVESIVAVDMPGERAQQVYAPGTPGIARACLKQALMDTLRMKRSELTGTVDPRNLLPKTGRVAYMATIDWNRVREWVDTPEGKTFLKETLEKVK